jgi:DNA-binding NtrC family response regulator
VRLQAKLLRAIQERVIDRVGGTHPIKVDIRVLATTNRDLESEVRAGRFREDLFYRLNVMTLKLPPLRERGDDIEHLARFFLRACSERMERPDVVEIAPEAMAVLKAHDWPGNIRSLENAIERAVLLCDGATINVDTLPAKVRRTTRKPTVFAPLPESGIDLRSAVDEYENDMIRQALDRTQGNKNRASQLLGLNRTTLVEMLKRKGM